MTFKDLRKRINSTLEISHHQKQQTRLFDICKDKPFWIWDVQEHKLEDFRTKGECCFNHIIGLPTKEGLEKPMFDYEKILYDSLLNPESYNTLNHRFKNKHLWVKKATGLGVTEFFLRLMAWLCLKDNSYRNSQMCIVTGPNIDIAIKLIKRIKGLFEPKLGLTFANKETVLELNGCRIEAYPSNHIDAYRALDNPKFILLDEADFFRKGEQEDVRHVSERYIAKSDPYIVMVSTPNSPDGLFEAIEKEPVETCLYKRLFLDYTYGLDRIYSREEIEKAKASPSFEREYNLKYLGRIGNVFHTKDIEEAIEKGRNYDPDDSTVNSYAAKSMGIDPAYGSSNFGIVITQFSDGVIQVLYADEFPRPDYNEMLGRCIELIENYNIAKVYIDGSNPSFIRSLKQMLGERSDYEKVIEYYKKIKWHWKEHMQVIPVNFSTEHREMLGHAKMLMEEGKVAINPIFFDKLVISLRTAVENEGSLDKEATSHNDILDAFRMCLKRYEFKTTPTPEEEESSNSNKVITRKYYYSEMKQDER
jgi:hypothetical protein